MSENKQSKINIAGDIIVYADDVLALLKSSRLLYDFIWELGYDLEFDLEPGRGFTTMEKIVSIAEILSEMLQDVADFAVEPPKTFSDWKGFFRYVGEILAFGGKLADGGLRFKTMLEEKGVDTSGEDWETLGKILLELLRIYALKYFEIGMPGIESVPKGGSILSVLGKTYHAWVLLGIIEPGSGRGFSEPQRDGSGRIVRFPQQKTKIHWDRLGPLFTDPGPLLKQEYFEIEQGEEDDDAYLKKVSDKFFKRLKNFLKSINAKAVYGLKPAEWLDFDDPLTRIIHERTLTFWYELFDKKLILGASLSFLRTKSGDIGMLVVPLAGGSYTFNFKGWKLELEGTQFSKPFVINGEFPDELKEEGGDAIETQLAFKLSKGDDEPAYVIGGQEGTRLEFGQISLSAGINISTEEDDYGFLFEMNKTKLILEGGDGDGFLKKILPEKGANIDFDLGIGYSTAYGFFIKGGTGLEVEFPKNKTFGKDIFRLSAIKLGINANPQDMRFYAAFSGGVKLGPVDTTIDTMGIQGILTFGTEEQNSDFDLDFKPPKGVGIKIDAKAVKGGGFLYFDKEKGQYAGVAELSIKEKVTVKAVGIITTKMPDGSEGYSFLLFISTQFKPVQLGLGFTLNGVGGLVGINRSMDLEFLRKGVREKTLDDILFPENPLENAPRIISNMSTGFPILDDQYTFGLMALIAWGSEDFISLELGLMIEFPEPVRLALIGVFKVSVSKKKLSVVKLQINFIGTVDFDKKLLTFDASLYNSTLLSFRLEGDAALRYSWGNPSYFIFSLGGFHPDYNEIPQGFPTLSKLMLPLVDRKNVQLLLTFYLAITSNSFQVGASVFLLFKISKFKLTGEFSFDALFHSATDFIVDVTAAIEIAWGSTTLAGVKFDGRLKGMSPWNIKGEATIKLLFWSKTFHVDKTYGEKVETSQSGVELLEELKKEISDVRNWEQITPKSSQLLVTTKSVSTSEQGEERPMLVHPIGGVAIRQTLIPLKLKLEKFGSQKVAGFNQFELQLTNGQANEVLPTKDEEDFFAPGQYLEFSDEQKLKRKSYERFSAGILMQEADSLSYSNFHQKTLEYERKIYDGDGGVIEVPDIAEENQRFAKWLQHNATAKSEIGLSAEYQKVPQEYQLKAEQFTIVYNENLWLYEENFYLKSEAEAEQALEKILEIHPKWIGKLGVISTLEMD